VEELQFYSIEVTVLGTYPASPFRADPKTLEVTAAIPGRLDRVCNLGVFW
jgi:hypothetical protein